MIKRSFCVLLALAAVCSAAFSVAQADLLTVDAFVKMTRCTGPRISPDGKMVAFVVSVPDLDENRSNSDIWLVQARGGDPRRLTVSDGADYRMFGV